ncbi:translocase subunit SecA, partial [Musa troglodytarum]
MRRSARKKGERNHSPPPKSPMASGVLAWSFLFTSILGLHTVCSSETLVGFSYDAREENTAPWLPWGARLKMLMANQGAYLDSVPITSISVNLCVSQFEVKKLLESKTSATSWPRAHLMDTLPKLNIDSIIVSSDEESLPSLLATLTSVRTSLKTSNLDRTLRITVMFSLLDLKTLHRTHPKSIRRVMHVLKDWESHVVVEAVVDEDMSLDDDFLRSTIRWASSACTYLPYLDIPIILIVKSSLIPTGVEIANFSDGMMKSLRSDALLRRRIAGLFIDISHLRQYGKKTFDWQEKLMVPSLQKELLNHGRRLIAATKTTLYDTFTPITNPVTTPITIPSTNPAPAIVTVPSTNPVTVLPTIPTMSPVNIPPMNPVSTPITVPATDPFPTPVTTPVVPVTNPTTTTYPTNPPVTNPVTSYPFTPPGSTPSMLPPVTVPSTVPITPAASGQTWCVAKAGTPNAALQLALDYACGIGGADCSAIQPTGSCYNPDTLQAHASYAFNSYYQKNPVASSCDFAGTAMLVNANPSTTTCIFPSSSSVPGYSPTFTGAGSTPSSGSSVLNTYNPAGSNSGFYRKRLLHHKSHPLRHLILLFSSRPLCRGCERRTTESSTTHPILRSKEKKAKRREEKRDFDPIGFHWEQMAAASPLLSVPVAKTEVTLLSGSNLFPRPDRAAALFRRDIHRRPAKCRPARRRPPAAVASLGGLLGGIFKGTDTGEGTRQRFSETVVLINRLEPEMSRLSDSDLRERTSLLKERARNDESLDSLLPEAFAVVREASKRVLGLRPFDVQLIGGMVLHKGEIAEMRTGEGKTLVAVLPAYLNALSGKGVHVVTVNDYLARRDCEWVGQVPRFLGLQVGLIQQNMTSEQRRENYLCDITYVTNSELGFDYLRDNLAMTVDELVLRDFNFCVIDEVDSILIDEARTPLIISGLAEKPSDRYYKAAKIAAAFERDIHYTVDEKQKTILLTEQGYEDAEEILDIKDLYDPREQWASYVLNAIKAKELFLRDVNYIVRGKEVLIVDEFTGRVMQGRRWSDGLHQAVEAKEGLPVQNETITLASISYQNFFLQFPKLCGMTGTAATESAEFESIYKLKVSIVPTNKPMIRKDESDVVFRATTGKWRAVVVEISRMHKTGRPVLVGTTSVEQSDALSEQLHEDGIPHEVLNAKPENVEREAEIVAQSGRLGAVTIATNMAGRGTDIILGGNAEFMARLKLREILMPSVVKPIEGVFVSVKKLPPRKTWKVNEKLFPCDLSKETISLANDAVELAVKSWGQRSLTELEAEERLSYSCEKGPTRDEVIAKLRDAFIKIVQEYKVYTDEERKKVVAAGGLHVVGTERHESRRIDNQLRGRSGRQGDPGGSRFFLSLEDNLFRVFGGDRIQGLMRAFRVEDLPIESTMLTKALDEAQRKSLIVEYAELTMDDILEANISPDTPKENWDLEKLIAKVQQYCYLLNDLTPELVGIKCPSYEDLREYLRYRGCEAYFQKMEIVEKQAPGLMKEAERFLILTNIDRLWKEHLQAIKFVQQAVGLRGYAQRDPLIEYKLEGYNLFLEMMAQIRRNVIYSIYQFQPVLSKSQQQGDGSNRKDSRRKGADNDVNPIGTLFFKATAKAAALNP